PLAKARQGLSYALVEMVDDLALWLLLGLGLAALIMTLLPPMAMAAWGSGLLAMLMMVLIGIPMYICATASTPVAAALLFAGVSPGTVLVFLLAGPATNIATIGVLHKEMGRAVMLSYLFGISASSIALGLLTDWLISSQGWDIQAQMGNASEWMPEWLAIGSGVILLLALVNSLFGQLRRRFAQLAVSTS
ncbi:MAG: permease, partial [Gammaproteobacteria bacterium]|nr:permease [Gammaproteobacteria bacterium]